MESRREQARRDFKRMVFAILTLSVIVVIAALWWMNTQSGLRLHMVLATIAGVFASMVLGAGLMSLAFYSAKSGKDDDVNDATRNRDKPR